MFKCWLIYLSILFLSLLLLTARPWLTTKDRGWVFVVNSNKIEKVNVNSVNQVLIKSHINYQCVDICIIVKLYLDCLLSDSIIHHGQYKKGLSTWTLSRSEIRLWIFCRSFAHLQFANHRCICSNLFRAGENGSVTSACILKACRFWNFAWQGYVHVRFARTPCI